MKEGRTIAHLFECSIFESFVDRVQAGGGRGCRHGAKVDDCSYAAAVNGRVKQDSHLHTSKPSSLACCDRMRLSNASYESFTPAVRSRRSAAVLLLKPSRPLDACVR